MMSKYMSLLLGLAFCISASVIVFFVRMPSASLIFVCRVMLALGAGGLIAILPQMFSFRWRGLYFGAAFVVFILLYFVNPPLRFADGVTLGRIRSIEEMEAFVDRGMYSRASVVLDKLSRHRVRYVAVPFFRGVIQKRRLKYAAAEHYFKQSLEWSRQGAENLIGVSDADILYEIGFDEEGRKRALQSIRYYDLARKAAEPKSYRKGESIFAVGRLSLAEWVKAGYPSRSALLREAINDFQTFDTEHWPGVKVKFWGAYYLACIYNVEASGASGPTQRRSDEAKERTYAAQFVEETRSLNSSEEFDLRVVVAMMFDARREALPGVPLRCNSSVNLNKYFVNISK